MSLRRFLEINSQWGTALTREEAAEVVLANCGAEVVEAPEYDPADHLLRKEIQHWAFFQAPPVEVKQNLLRAAASQRDAVDADLPQVHTRPGDELRCAQTRGHEVLASYLVLSIQYMHVRLVA